MTDPENEIVRKRVSDELNIGLSETMHPLWTHGNFAHAWFADAHREASLNGYDARRREIVFAVCAAESYLVEWVRDEVLKGMHERLNHYFPADTDDKKQRKSGICDRWKEVVNHLNEDGSIKAKPDRGNESVWSDFNRLVDFRNGLVHGRASRPDTAELSSKQRPLPTVEQLERLLPGWAVDVVASLIRTIHKAVGSTPPSWLAVTDDKSSHRT